MAARAGDPDALATLYTALEPKITRFVRRYRGWIRTSWDVDDVAQEAYLALARLVEQWSGEGLFLPYFFATFRCRLADAVRRLDGPAPLQPLSRMVDLVEHAGGDAVGVAELRADLAALVVRFAGWLGRLAQPISPT